MKLRSGKFAVIVLFVALALAVSGSEILTRKELINEKR